MVTLRPYQLKAKQDVYSAWGTGHQNVCLVAPTGAGKTVTMGSIVHEHQGASCVIAHRQELVSQISKALAREGIRHKIIGSMDVVKLCVQEHMEELGKSFYDPNSKCAVAGVDTLVRRTDELARWLQTVSLWVIDEAHHVCTDNKWGKAVSLFPNAKGLGVTATPQRADGKGLSRATDGVFDTVVLSPDMRSLIDNKFLTEYRIFAPPSDLDLTDVKVSTTTGDYSAPALVQATRKSHIMGDVVSHYLKIAKGKRGITFATDVQSAKDIAEQFNLAGVPALALDGKTPAQERIKAIRSFRDGKVLQIVNCDLFGEGFDLPAIEVVSIARATASYGLYVQVFGRALRPMEGKTLAIIIDHVGNVLRHGLPDAPRAWSLDRREKKSKGRVPDVIPVKACPTCAAAYERTYPACPYCGFKVVATGRTTPELVDGDLRELTSDVLAEMRKAIAHVDMGAPEYSAELLAKRCPPIGVAAGVKRHLARQEAQAILRDKMSWWMGYRKAEGDTISIAQRRFYLKFGIDVMTAQALGTTDALELSQKVEAGY